MPHTTLLTPLPKSAPNDPHTKEGHCIWTAVFSPKGLQHLSLRLSPQTVDMKKYVNATHRDPLDPRIKILYQKLLDRMEGRRSELSWNELDLSDAPVFHQRVWRELMNIPFGQTRTYIEISKIVGSPKAARACGQACRSNRILLFIPCHRVVAVHGLGGFSGGIELKKLLLKSEGAKDS
jgi:O-6-methylguanine DNA methyltransferase